MMVAMELRAAPADRRAPFTLAALALAGCAYLALNDPSDPSSVMPTCPTKLITGLDCPACGGLRMVRALLYGDVRAAARANALLLLASPVLIGLWVMWCRDALAGRPRRGTVTRPVAVALIALATSWTIARNLV